MNVEEWIITTIYDMRNDNIEPTLITLGRNVFENLRNEVMLISTMKVFGNENRFMGIEVAIDDLNINLMKVE